jgi:hypothetical protein
MNMDKKYSGYIVMSDGLLSPNDQISYNGSVFTYLGKSQSSSGELCGVFKNGEVECFIPVRIVRSMKDKKLVY